LSGIDRRPVRLRWHEQRALAPPDRLVGPRSSVGRSGRRRFEDGERNPGRWLHQDMLSLGFVLPAGQRDILYLSALTASDVTCSGTSAPLNV